MASFLLLHHAFDEGPQVRVVAAALHHAIEIVVHLREQAGTDLAVAGDTDA